MMKRIKEKGEKKKKEKGKKYVLGNRRENE